MQTSASSTLPQLRGLIEVSRLVREERDLRLLCDRIAETISESLGFRTIAINLYRPAEGDFEVVTVHGNEAAREALLGSTRSVDAWAPFMVDGFHRRGAYLIPHDEADWEGVPSHIPDLPLGDSPDAWHPEDALIVPMRSADGTLLGVVSVDEPESGLRPGDDELDVLVAFAEHVGAALEAAQESAAAARDRASLSQLLEVSASLVDLDAAGAVLDAVAGAIHGALGFEKVAVCLVGEDGRFYPAGTAGWEQDAPGLDFCLSQDDLDLLFVPAFEREGCYLIENDAARARVSGSSYSSRRNGLGPRAWSCHWLLVPLVERDGSRRGFIWADDPADALLPSPAKLQALRTFANQATMALRTALDFELLSARNSELAALHETTLALLDRRDVDSVLRTMLDSARGLVGTEHGYLYVVDPESDHLRLAVGLGYFEQVVPRPLARGEGLSGRVWERGCTLVVEDYAEWPGAAAGYESVHASVGVPLLAAGELVGVLGLVQLEPERRFDAAEVELLERFARLASLALENARLYATIRRSEELHRSVVHGSTDLIALVEPEGSIVLASPAFERILGYEPASLLGTNLGGLVHPDDLVAARGLLVDELLAEPTQARLRASDGRWVLVEGITTPIHDADGALELRLVIARDVTERRRLEEQLRQAQKMESIGRLAGGIAHDFNNLLTAISGYAELGLFDVEPSSPLRDNLEQIARAAGRAADLTGQLLAYSRKQVLRPQLLDLNTVVTGMAPMLGRMLGEDVVLTTTLDPELGLTRADPAQIEQVVLNLAVNARDAMPRGGKLHVRTVNLTLEEGPHVALVVADTGNGMDEDVTAQIFEPFFTTKPVGEGTGLGLATVHGIVAQSGGAVSVVSEPGIGTTFTVCLPLAT